MFARGQVGGLGAFVDGQGVEIDAEGDRGAGAPSVVGADDAGETVAEACDPNGIGTVAERLGAGGGDFGGGRDFHAGVGAHDLDAGGDVPTEFFQRGGDERGGAEFTETEFGVTMEIAAPVSEFAGEGGRKRGSHAVN